MKIGVNTVVGGLLDLFDFGIGMIPIVGDAVDILASLYWFKKLGPTGLVGLIEVIPGLDLLPTNLALGYMADQKGGKKE